MNDSYPDCDCVSREWAKHPCPMCGKPNFAARERYIDWVDKIHAEGFTDVVHLGPAAQEIAERFNEALAARKADEKL